jgi:hypothetical protein
MEESVIARVAESVGPDASDKRLVWESGVFLSLRARGVLAS